MKRLAALAMGLILLISPGEALAGGKTAKAPGKPASKTACQTKAKSKSAMKKLVAVETKKKKFFSDEAPAPKKTATPAKAPVKTKEKPENKPTETPKTQKVHKIEDTPVVSAPKPVLVAQAPKAHAETRHGSGTSGKVSGSGITAKAPVKVAMKNEEESRPSEPDKKKSITEEAPPIPVSSENPHRNAEDTSAPSGAPARNIAKEEEGTPRITAIEFSGNQNVSTEEMMKVIRSKVGDPLLEPRIRSDAQALFETGYFTDVKVDTPYYAGGLKVVFRLQENPKVSKITILGNKMVKTERIKELIQTKEGQILNMKTLNADINEINYYYDETLGYLLKPTHIKNVNWTPSGELVLTIDEGMVIKEIKVTGSSLYSEEKMNSLVRSKPGDLFNSNEIKKDTTEISKFYEEEGYILDTVRPQVNYRDGTVTIQVIEAMVEDIKLDWANEKHKTKDVVVFRNIRTRKGEVLQRKKLQRDIERLNNLGYFSKVNVEPEPGNKPGNTILVFKLKEQKTGLATIGVGYTGGGSGALRSGITGAISYRESNLGGTGQGASASWQRGVNIDAVSVTYTNPAINKNQDSIGVSLFKHNYLELRQPLENTTGDSRYALYDDKRQGGAFTFGKRITDDFRLFLSYRHETLEISRNANSDYEPIGISKGTLKAASLGALFDTRNDVFDPVEGWFVDANFTYGGQALKGAYDFNKYTGELRKYIPIGKKQRSTIALRAWGGSVSGKSAPITETFYVGGTDTIRGYNENNFYGTKMVVLNAEYRFPIANIKFLKGAVFGDAGNAWFPSDARKRLYTDYGAGLRIVFPTLGLGVIRLDYARGEEGGRTSIGIGQTF